MGQGHHSQGTMMVLPYLVGTGTLPPTMPHHAWPCSGEQPPRNGSQGTFSTIGRAQSTQAKTNPPWVVPCPPHQGLARPEPGEVR